MLLKTYQKVPHKICSPSKAWVTRAIFTDRLRALNAKMSFQNRKVLPFGHHCAMYPQAQDASYLKDVKIVVLPSNCASILQPLDQVIQTLLQAACGKKYWYE